MVFFLSNQICYMCVSVNAFRFIRNTVVHSLPSIRRPSLNGKVALAKKNPNCGYRHAQFGGHKYYQVDLVLEVVFTMPLIVTRSRFDQMRARLVCGKRFPIHFSICFGSCQEISHRFFAPSSGDPRQLGAADAKCR